MHSDDESLALFENWYALEMPRLYRYVMYRGVTTTAVMVAQQLNTSGVYDIA